LDDHQRDVRFQVTKKMQDTVPQKFNATLTGFVTTRQLATFDPYIISHSHDSPTIHRYNGFLSRIHSRQQYMAATAIVRRVQDPSGPPEEMRSMRLQWIAMGCNLNRLVTQDASHEPECSHVKHSCETSYLNSLHSSPVTVPVHCRLWIAEEGGVQRKE